MATAKKSVAKSKAKVASAKKPVVKRAPAKAKPATKVTRSKVVPEHKSFRVSRNPDEFFTFRITHQTLYWIILAGIVLLLGLWVTSISMKVQDIYDQIDTTTQETMSIPVVPKN